MTPILTAAELAERLPPDTLPTDAEGNFEVRVTLALEAATGTIVALLPWFLGDNGEIAQPLPPQFAGALAGICADIALYRIFDAVSASEDTREKYAAAIKLLQQINRDYQGGLSGPGYQTSAVVVPNDVEGIADGRFWKKGRVF